MEKEDPWIPKQTKASRRVTKSRQRSGETDAADGSGEGATSSLSPRGPRKATVTHSYADLVRSPGPSSVVSAQGCFEVRDWVPVARHGHHPREGSKDVNDAKFYAQTSERLPRGGSMENDGDNGNDLFNVVDPSKLNSSKSRSTSPRRTKSPSRARNEESVHEHEQFLEEKGYLDDSKLA